MTRALHADLEAATLAALVRPALLVKFEFAEGDICLWSGLGDLASGGDTFTGVGVLGGVDTIEERGDLSAVGARFSLSGVPSEYIALALAQGYKGRPVTLWLAALDADFAMLGDAYQLFAGDMDQMSHVDDGQSATITVTAENALIEFDDANGGRYTDEDQKRRYPADRGLEFIARLQDKSVTWGRAP